MKLGATLFVNNCTAKVFFFFSIQGELAETFPEGTSPFTSQHCWLQFNEGGGAPLAECSFNICKVKSNLGADKYKFSVKLRTNQAPTA